MLLRLTQHNQIEFQDRFLDLLDSRVERTPDIHRIIHAGQVSFRILRYEERVICPLYDILV